MIPRHDATARNPWGCNAPRSAPFDGSGRRVAQLSSRALRALASCTASAARNSGARDARPREAGSLSIHNRTTQGPADSARLDANNRGKGEPGNAAPSATRRTSRTGRPRQTKPVGPLRHLRLVGLPGERAQTAFPLPGTGEGAEGVGWRIVR